MTARRAFLIVGLIAAAALVPLAATGDGGLTVLLFVTPPDRGVSETLSIDVEVYWWGQPTSADSVRLTVSSSGASPTLSNVSTGKYHASYKILQGDLRVGSLSIQASANKAGRYTQDTAYYALRGAFNNPGWQVQVRIVSPANLAPPPGSLIVFEARSYSGGALAEGGPINATLVSEAAGVVDPLEILPTTRAADGVYRFNLQIPANLSLSRAYDVTARLGVAYYGASTEIRFTSNPVPVTAYMTGGNDTEVTLRVIAGSNAPVGGAMVELKQQTDSPSPRSPGPSPPVYRNTTGADGIAELVVLKESIGGTYPDYVLNVSQGNRTTSQHAYLSFANSTAWRPEPPYNYSCEARLQSDPTGFSAGETAALSVRVTHDGAPLVNRSVSRFAWRAGYAGTETAGNVTTDAAGNFSLTYAIASNWTSGDSMTVLVVCPSGEAARLFIQFGPLGLGFASRDLHVSVAGALGGDLSLNATYTGARPLEGATALALLIPGRSTTTLVARGPPDALYVPLSLQGSIFSGRVSVPAWMAEGDYIVVVLLSSTAATSQIGDQVTETAVAAVSLHPVPPPPPSPPAPPSRPPYAAAQSSMVSAALAAISISIGALQFVSKRKRRIADARGERGERDERPPGHRG